MTKQTVLQHHTEAWRQCVFVACGDQRIADRAIEMAILNGLFDLHREADELRGIASDSRVSDAAIGIRVRNGFDDCEKANER